MERHKDFDEVFKDFIKDQIFNGTVTIFHNKGEKKGCNFFLFFSIDSILLQIQEEKKGDNFLFFVSLI